jgi:dimethylaniline monooxygenase (N-oxide forming)
VYDAFWTQTPVGLAELSDQSLPPIPETDSFHGFFPARYVAHYLNAYVEDHVYSGKTLASRILTNSRVMHLTKATRTGEWHAEIYKSPDAEDTLGYVYKMTAPKVIDATGLTSSPHLPRTLGLDTFTGETLHQRDVGKSGFLTNEKQHHVVVIGGAKSAADLAYASAKAGKRVSWIVRKSGSGPASMAPAKGSGLYKNSNESFYTRLTVLFLASVFIQAGSVESLLHRTKIGRYLFSRLWDSITARAWKEANYAGRQNTKPLSRDVKVEGKGFANLQPDTNLFWQNDSSGINQHPDFFSTIASKVAVYREDFESISENHVTLADNFKTCIAADVLLLATGWSVSKSMEHISPATALRLGLPVQKDSKDADALASSWAALESQAESEILRRFPILEHPPAHHSEATSLTPFRLYKSMLPITDHSIVFLGKIMLGNHFRAAEVQALWALSVFDGTLDLPTEDVMRKAVAETVAWCRKRYLGKGHLGNWFWFDMVPYTDALLAQLGLESHMKGGWRGLWRTCFAQDLKGLIGEYKEKYSGDSR